jgi:uroporphyrinogen III methyltransferase / synthase
MKGPLSGRRVVVTRAAAQAGDLSGLLAEAGAEVLAFSAIRVELTWGDAARDAIGSLARYDWLVLTSTNGVRAVHGLLREAGRDPGELRGLRICSVGPATARAVRETWGCDALVPESFHGAGAAEVMIAAGVGTGSRVLLPRAEVAGSELPSRLREAGAEVDEIAVYRTLADGAGADHIRAALDSRTVWAVTFASGSAVHAFVERVGTGLGGALAVSIGPATSAALRGHAMPVDIEAVEHTARGLVRALEKRSTC